MTVSMAVNNSELTQHLVYTGSQWILVQQINEWMSVKGSEKKLAESPDSQVY